MDHHQQASNNSNSMALTETQKTVAKTYDLTAQVLPFVDRHLLYPLLDSLVAFQPVEDVDQLEFDVLKDTYMTGLLRNIYQSLHPDASDLPKELLDRDAEIMAKLVPLNESTKKTLDILCSKDVQENLKQDKVSNRELIKKHGIDDEKILELYEFGKLQYNRGDYVMASDLLNNFKLLSINEDLILNATCGKFVSDITSADIAEAKNEMTKLREIIDNRNFKGTPLEQLKLRNWLIHNSLFIFFNDKELADAVSSNNKLNNMNDVFLSSSYLSTIEASCPWILRYIIAIVLYTKDMKKLKDVIRAVEIENYEFKDPFTNLISALFITFDFNSIPQILFEVTTLVKSDFFLSHFQFNHFLERIIELVLKSLLKVYKSLSVTNIKVLLGNEDIITDDLVKNIIDENNDLVVDPEAMLVTAKADSTSKDKYFQVYEKTKALSFKSTQYFNNAFGK